MYDGLKRYEFAEKKVFYLWDLYVHSTFFTLMSLHVHTSKLSYVKLSLWVRQTTFVQFATDNVIKL